MTTAREFFGTPREEYEAGEDMRTMTTETERKAQIDCLIGGLRKAICDPECPGQFSPLLMECAQVLSAQRSTLGEGRASDIRAWADRYPGDPEALSDALIVEIERLRKGIQNYLDGDYEPKIIGKVNKCPHGKFKWEACENCIDEHFTKLLTLVPAPSGGGRAP